jgi:WD40 repeat protein
MRIALMLGLVVLLPVPVLAQGKKFGPVKIIELDRKEPIVYQKDIEPIFYKRCITCHSGSVKEYDFDITSYENVIKGGKGGSPVVPGKAKKSKIYQMLTREDKPFMPPKSEDPVTPEELALVKLWIDQGAQAPTGPSIVTSKVLIGLLPTAVTPVRALAISPDKSTIAAGRGNQIDVYDANSGTFIRALEADGLQTHDKKVIKGAHSSIVESMAFSPDGKYLASGSFQEVHLWDVKTGTLLQRLKGFAHNVVALTFSPDNKLLATAGGAQTQEGEIKFFEIGSWKQVGEVKNGHSDTVYGISFSPDSKKIVSGSADKFVKVFDVPSGTFDRSFEGHTHHVLDVGWYTDGKLQLIASASADKSVKVWDYDKKEQVRAIANAHGNQITRLAFIGKSPNFVTCAGDNTVKFFNVTNGGNVRTFTGNKDFVYAVAVSNDGKILAAGGEEGLVRVYNGDSGALTRTLTPPGVAPPATTKK